LIGVLRLFPDRVEIAAGRYETTHPRRRSTTPYVAPEVDAAAIDQNATPRPRRPTGSGPIPISPTITGSA